MTSNNNKLTVMVTGASGFLGNELVNQLLQEDNIRVVAVTSKPDDIKLKYLSFDLLALYTSNWQETLKEEVDVIVNCAFPRTSQPDELAKGILFTEKLVRYAHKLKIKSLINISSQSVYTQKDKIITNEKALISPETLYGMAKYSCERIVELLCKEYKMNYSNIRLASLTGLNFDVRMTNRFVDAALNGEKITIYGGKQKISYLEVRDTAEALIRMILSEASEWENAYNLGNNEAVTLLELISIVQRESRKYNKKEINVELLEEKNSFNNLIDSNLFYSTFNWRPNFTVEKMIKELCKHKSISG
ncbi:NAD-dependent epimerase/dehydratase family protein [Ornithinibacillus sp. 4-3]|uniref:NAD-dependent epimerase/dehydratase family protein n=1 Tax=Ornithinibacillus sp. 4-3 TaxID=3231488 RepID=A0AB39HIT8_9BACI